MGNLATQNPILDRSGPPRFDDIRPEHVVPAIREALSTTEAQFRALETGAAPTWSGLVEPLERLQETIDFPWHLVSHLMYVRNSSELREAYETMQPDVVRLSLKMRQSRPIYDRLVAMRDGTEWAKLDEGQQRIVSNLIRDADHMGVGLETDARERFNSVQRELAKLGTEFSNHVLDATRAFSLVLTKREEVSGLPESLLHLTAQSAAKYGHPDATPENGPWRITLDGPVAFPFLENADRRDLREQLYRANITRASSGENDNTAILGRILELRQEAAELVGFDHYAALSIDSKMAADVDDVRRLMEELLAASADAARADQRELEAFARETLEDPTYKLMNWDAFYWSQKLRLDRFGYTEEDLRPYFPMPVVLDGLFALIHRLFDVRITDASGTVPVWHPDVRYYTVADATGETIASFYFDPYSRPSEKQGGAWQDGLTTRSRALATPGEDVQKASAFIVCNQTPPVGGGDARMSFGEVRTLFHEFGHGLQHLLTQVEYGMASGTYGIEWDAIEIPSMFMENWWFQPDTLKALSKHVETGESVSDELIESIRRARGFRAGTGLQRQLGLTLTDLELHQRYRAGDGRTPFDVAREVNARISTMPALPEDRFLCTFSHIFAGAYAAGYYSYLWANVLSSDAFSKFEEEGFQDDASVVKHGHRFRDTFLALGGSRDPMEVFVDFRGRKPSTTALLRHLGLSGA